MPVYIENLIAHLTLEEKVSLLAGADLWHTVPVERLGIPVLKVTDGPNGARGAEGSMGPASVCFPAGIALGATWNPALVERIGQALGDETKAKGAHILLAPTVNIHRSPLSGRNFEFYAEDPYLSGRMAIAYIQGLQSRGVGACIKHFVCNDSEFERQSINSVVGERALREIYLVPFQMAIREAKPWAVMSAYNKINGVYASENDYLLRDILKGEWGFDGLVISDWFGTYSPRVAGSGLDLEMPGPTRWMGEKALAAVRSGQVPEAVVDDKVSRLLRTLERAGRFETPALEPEQAVDLPAHRQVVREAAREAMVLLKNEPALLPLAADKVKSIAVIGANARWAQIIGGGSAAVTPHYVVSPLDGLRERAGASVKVGYALGCPIHQMLPLLDPGWLAAENGAPGFDVELFDNSTLAGAPAATLFVDRMAIEWTDRLLARVNRQKFSLRLSARFTAPEAGHYTFGLEGSGQHRLFIDSTLVVDGWSDRPAIMPPWVAPEKTGGFDLRGGQTVVLRIEYASEATGPWRRLRLGCLPPLPADPVAEAVALAAGAEVALVFAGLTNEWESEGYDRPDMDLPGAQVELIEKVAAANPNTIVVLNTGSPITMPWLDKVPAVLQAWFAGQEAGHALADIVFGDESPSGKLPQTYPQRLADNPAFINYPGEKGEVVYGEGVFVGYRYYDKKDIAPLFPFGHGLSYTTFAYTHLKLNATYAPGEPIQVSLEVENTGKRAGKEVVQLYIRDVQASVLRPEQELKAFAKVALAPGQTQTVSFTLDETALAFYDPSLKRWVAEPGRFEVRVGSSSRDLRLTAQFELKTAPRPAHSSAARLHVGLTLETLLADAAGRRVMETRLGELLGHAQTVDFMQFSLEQIGQLLPLQITPERLQTVNAELAALE
jgi:beta-glucosidase